MSYDLEISPKANNDIVLHKQSGNKVILKKLSILFHELTEHPYSGIGKPEQLKHNLTGLWSRRINQTDRLVYEVLEKTVSILSVKGHYE